jgi:hypothetical protein
MYNKIVLTVSLTMYRMSVDNVSVIRQSSVKFQETLCYNDPHESIPRLST